jgi:hypothetical protein
MRRRWYELRNGRRHGRRSALLLHEIGQDRVAVTHLVDFIILHFMGGNIVTLVVAGIVTPDF